MTAEEIVDEILQKEGGFREQVQRPDGSYDPHTKYGITAITLGEWRHLGVPASRSEVLHLTEEEARAIYQTRYIDLPGFTPENVPFEPLRVQLIDFGVNSGPERAIRWLQRVLRLQDVDGRILGVAAYLAGYKRDPRLLEHHCALINDALVAARSYMIDRAVDQGTMRKADEEGVESRALSFFLAKP